MAISLCIIAAVFWSLFDLFRKISLKYYKVEVLLLLFTFSQMLLFVFWVCNEKNNFFLNQYIFYGLVLVILSTYSNILFMRAINIAEISVAIPLLSFTPLFSTVFAYIFLDEKLIFIDYIGIFIIIFGALSLHSKSMHYSHIFNAVYELYVNKSSRYMLIVCFIWSLAPTLDKTCLKYTSIQLHGLIQSLGMLLLLLLFNYRNLNININKNQKYSLLLFTIIFGIGANIVQFYAILINYISTMESIKRTVGQVSSVVLGRIVLKEVISINKIIGIGLMTIGVLLLLTIN